MDIASDHLIRQRQSDAPTGGTEGVSQCDGPAHHIQRIPIDFTDRLRPSQFLFSPLLGLERLNIGEHLSRKRLVHLDQTQLAPSYVGAMQRFRNGVSGTHEELVARIECRNGVRADIGERLVPERPRRVLTHQENR